MRALLLVALMACARDPFSPLPVGGSHVLVKEIPQPWSPKLDLLFVIDDSPAMASFRADLLANAPNFASVLTRGRLPDLHLAITTAGCEGDGGVLRTTPAVDGDFIIATPFADGGYATNVTDSLDHAMTALMDVGTTGCATVQPLAAAKRALASHPDFVRDDAYLALVVIAASDDTSPGAIADYVTWLEGLKRDPGTIFVTGIAGAGSCMYDGAVAADAVRLRQFLAQFPNRNTFSTICQADLSDGLGLLAEPIGVAIGDPCFYVAIDPDRCIATDRLHGRDVATLPACAGRLPCIRFIDDSRNCGATGASAQSIRVDRHDFALIGDIVHVECEIE